MASLDRFHCSYLEFAVQKQGPRDVCNQSVKVHARLGFTSNSLPFHAPIDNAVYDRPDIQPNSNGSLSYSSTYEVPLDTVRRPRLSSSYHKMDNSTDVYSTVDDRGFNDSFETEHGVPHYTNSEHVRAEASCTHPGL